MLATVRGHGRVKAKADEGKAGLGVSPYLQNQSSYGNDHHPPPLPASSSSTDCFRAFFWLVILSYRSGLSVLLLGSAEGDGQHSPNEPVSTLQF